MDLKGSYNPLTIDRVTLVWSIYEPISVKRNKRHDGILPEDDDTHVKYVVERIVHREDYSSKTSNVVRSYCCGPTEDTLERFHRIHQPFHFY